MSSPRCVLGLLGGIASGKSTVAAEIAKQGPGLVVDGDRLAHEALAATAKNGRLAAALGDFAVKKDGTPDRKAIAKRVFKDAVSLRSLERLIHPLVTMRIDEAMEEHLAGRGEPILVLDVPLLLEVGLDRRCDALWFVHVPDDLRFERAEKRVGLTKDEVLSREAAQSPLDRKRARADLVIDNGGDPSTLASQVEAGLRRLGFTGRPA